MVATRHAALLTGLAWLACGCNDAAPTDPSLRGVSMNELRTEGVDGALRGFARPDLDGGEADGVLADGWVLPGYPAFALDPPIDWHLDEVEARSWNMHLNALDPVAILLIGGEPPHVDAALRITEDWLAQNPRTPHDAAADAGDASAAADAGPAGETFQWYDMAVGRRAAILAYLVDRMRREPSFSDERLRALWLGLVDHLEYLADDALIAFHTNHGYFQVAGQYAAASRFAWLPPMADAVAQASDRLEAMMSEQFAPDGVHREHSPGYHWFVLLDWLSLVVDDGFDAPWSEAFTTRIEDGLAWLLVPNGVLPLLGDTLYEDVRAQLTRYPLASPALRYVASSGAEGAPPASAVGAFSAGGLAVMRTWEAPPDAASFLVEQCAFHSRAHKHADDLAIAWYDRGGEILVGPGRYGYLGRVEAGSELAALGFWYSDPRRIYVESTAAHNTVEIDGRSQDRTRPPFGSGLVYAGTQGELHLAVCRAPQADGVTQTRVVATAFGDWMLVLDLVDDSGGEMHDYRQWFHLAPALDAATPDGAVVAVSGAGTVLTAASLLAGAAWSAPIRGREDPLQGWWSPRVEVLEPATAIALEHPPAARASLATLFAFDGAVVPDLAYNEVDDASARLRWTQGGVSRELVLDGLDGDAPTASLVR